MSTQTNLHGAARSPSAHAQEGPAIVPMPIMELECATAYCSAMAAPEDNPER